MKSKILVIVINLVMGSIFVYGVWWTTHPTSTTPITPAPPPLQPLPAGVAFSSFGPSNTCGVNGWPVRSDGHADWFASKASGRLSAIELAIEPAGSQAGNLTVFIARDGRGFPGKVLENFQITISSNTVSSFIFKSITQPTLEADEKYWVCAKSSGGWLWRYNNLNLAQNAARGTKSKRWVSAGVCRVCAFEVTVVTNQPSSMTVN